MSALSEYPSNPYDRFYLWKCCGCGAVTILTAVGGTLADCQCESEGKDRDYKRFALKGVGEPELLSDLMGT